MGTGVSGCHEPKPGPLTGLETPSDLRVGLQLRSHHALGEPYEGPSGKAVRVGHRGLGSIGIIRLSLACIHCLHSFLGMMGLERRPV
jgi:hypothetical protein